MQLRLDKTNETGSHFIAEIREKKNSKRLSKYIAMINYFSQGLTCFIGSSSVSIAFLLLLLVHQAK